MKQIRICHTCVAAFFWLICLLETITSPAAYCQSATIDREAFFKDTSILHATLMTNLDRVLTSRREKDFEFPGNFITILPDGTNVNDKILLEVTGNFRLEFCYIPPVKLKFNYEETSKLYSLKSLKMVSVCKLSREYEQYLLKEYLIYKIYNYLTDKSFNVRLMRLNLQDSADKKKIITEYAFLLEDVKELAKRNHCKEWKVDKMNANDVDRQQMTMLSIFEYMIGNTDWAVSKKHNIKIIVSSKDSLAGIYAIPFDFDNAGFVNASYAIPEEIFNINSVTQRQFLGMPRNLPEFDEALKVFRLHKMEIYLLINNFDLLSSKSRKELIEYLDEFYEMINHPDLVKKNFINNAISQ